MTTHFIEKCRYCGTVQAQCRCPDPHKTVRFVVCAKCASGASNQPPKDEP